MSQRATIMSIILFALIVAGMFTFAFIKRSEVAENTATSTEQGTPAVAYAEITRITAKHFYIDGVHTLVGEVDMPTPCDLLESSALVMESMPEQIAVSFNVVNSAEFCAQVVTAQRFKVSASASPAATFTATFMGRPVELNLIPAEPGETPDDFELFIKG